MSSCFSLSLFSYFILPAPFFFRRSCKFFGEKTIVAFFCASVAVEKTSPLSFEEVFVSPQESHTFRTTLPPKNTTKKRPHAPPKKSEKKRCLFFLPLLGCLLETLKSHVIWERGKISLTHIFLYLFVAHTFTHTHARAIFINYSNKNAIFTISRNDHDSRRCRHGTFYSYFAFVFVFVFGAVFRRRKSFVFVYSLVVIVRGGVRYLIRDG